MTDRTALVQTLDGLLLPERFRDHAPNGLQVQGASQVRKIVSGVTASLALIEAAIAAQADTLLVHHGLFWRAQDVRVVGWLKQRLALLLAHDLNLIAYHLPLDGHAQWGNNAQLGRLLGWRTQARFGEQELGFLGGAEMPYANAQAWAAHVQTHLNRSGILLPGDGRSIRLIGWCSGGAQSYFEAAIAAGADAFLTGEISEPQAHLARESGVAFLACGHHATERYGVGALAGHVAAHFGLLHEFIDIDNPA